MCGYKFDAATSNPHKGNIKKTVTPGRMQMNFVTYNNIRLKCYLNFVLMAPHEVAGSPILARAINFFYCVSNKIKKICVYSFFMVTIISSLCELTSHAILLLSVNSSIPTISEGIVVLNDFEFGFCCMTFDFTSNNFTPPCLSFVINIFVNILYIIYL